VAVVYGAPALVPARANTYAPNVSEKPRIEAIADEHYETLLPMIAAYQGFYEADEIRADRNRDFFRRFLAPSDDGMILGAWSDGELVGYACMYWTFSSVRAIETVLMNDLYVDAGARGKGVGRALIEACAEVARERGSPRLEWSTAPDNETAQRLYDSFDVEKSTWIEYELGL
jgi:GNAT superfamily N-acetyltransferase